jgi:hypothetical protein
MGPYCKYCNSRCFVPIPEGAPAEILAAYGNANLMATCAQGKEAEKVKMGYCYDSLPAETRINANTILSSLERAELANQVYNCAFEASESFREDSVGADVAYLMGAILDDPAKRSTVNWTRDDHSNRSPALLCALRAKFPPTSPLWNFIVLGKRRRPTDEEMDAALGSLQAKGLIREVQPRS